MTTTEFLFAFFPGHRCLFTDMSSHNQKLFEETRDAILAESGEHMDLRTLNIGEHVRTVEAFLTTDFPA